MKKLLVCVVLAAVAFATRVAYTDSTTTTIAYYEAGNSELQYKVLPGDIGTDWIREDCYLHICYEPIKVAGQVLPNTASQERIIEISTGKFWGRKSLLIESKKIHIVSIS